MVTLLSSTRRIVALSTLGMILAVPAFAAPVAPTPAASTSTTLDAPAMTGNATLNSDATDTTSSMPAPTPDAAVNHNTTLSTDADAASTSESVTDDAATDKTDSQKPKKSR